MRQPPREVGRERHPVRKRCAPLPAVRHHHAGAVAAVPQAPMNLPELALHRQPQQLQPVGQHDERIRAGAHERVPSREAVDHLPGRGHCTGGAAHTHDRIGDALGAEWALPGRVLGAGVVDADAERIREHRLGMGVELGRRLLQPHRVPDVVVTRPREVRRRREALPGELQRATPVAHEPELTVVSLVDDSRVELGILECDGPAAVVRAVVHDDDREVVPALGEQGLERLGEVCLAVVDREAEDRAGGVP